MTEAAHADAGTEVTICAATTLVGQQWRRRIMNSVSPVHCRSHLDAAEQAAADERRAQREQKEKEKEARRRARMHGL